MKSLRDQFPLLKQYADLLYLDSAATALKPEKVLQAEQQYAHLLGTNAARGLYPLAEKTSAAIEKARLTVASFLHADSEEIIFSGCTTSGINAVVRSLETYFSDKNGEVLTGIDSHHSLALPLKEWAKRQEHSFRFLPVNTDGFYDEEQTLEHITPQTLVVGLTLVSNVTGVIQNLTLLIKKIRERNPNTFVLVDAAQAVAHIPIHMKELDADALVFSGHKMYGPTGIGVCFLAKRWQEILEPSLFGGGMVFDTEPEKSLWKVGPEKFEAGTLPLAQIFGLEAAVHFLQAADFGAIREHEQALLRFAFSQLSQAFGGAITFFGSLDAQKKIGLLSFTLSGVHPHDIASLLGEKNICVRAGEHCASFLHRSFGVPATTRISFGLYTSEEDIRIFVQELKNIYETLKP